MSTESSPAPRRERIIFIDALRGYAILMMLQGHTIGVVLREDLQDNKYPVHLAWWYLKGLTAPAFFTAAGLIFAYLLARSEVTGGARLVKGIKRGLWLLLLGWVLFVYPATFTKLFRGDVAGALSLFGRSHVLHTIGLGLIVMVLLWLVTFRKERVFAIVSFLVGQFAFLVGPVTETWSPQSTLGRAAGTFFAREFAAFPLLPWMGYALTGAALGVLAWETKWYRNPKGFLFLALAGILLMAGSGPVTSGFWKVFGGIPGDLTAGDLSGRYWRSGEVLLLMALVGLACSFILKKGWEDKLLVRIFTTCGQETLTIYFLHVIVVYSALFGFGLSTTCRREFGVAGSLLTAALVEAAFILLAMNLSRLRKKWPLLGLLR